MRAVSTCRCLLIAAVKSILLLPLVPAGIGMAATIYSGTNIDVLATSLVAPGGNFRGFTLSAIGKNGAQPRVLDSTKSGRGGTGITTSGNLLYQVWEGGFVPTPAATLVVPGSVAQTIDTHFLVDTASVFIVQLPTENRPVLDAFLHPYGGYGSFLTGSFALLGPASSAWNFAYIVVPVGTTVHFDFEVGAAGFSSETVTTAFAVNFARGDVNMDAVVNIFDINLVSANWGGTGLLGDANGDGAVNIFDINLISANWGIPGDVNHDGHVNIFDINLVSANWGGMGPTGDANQDGMVDIFDINLISSNWTPTGGAGSATSVPEPSTLALATLGLLSAIARRLRRESVDLISV